MVIVDSWGLFWVVVMLFAQTSQQGVHPSGAIKWLLGWRAAGGEHVLRVWAGAYYWFRLLYTSGLYTNLQVAISPIQPPTTSVETSGCNLCQSVQQDMLEGLCALV